MNKLRGLWRRITGLFRRGRRDAELAAELESHLQFHIEDNLRAGMTPGEARRQALIKLGGVDQTKEAVRDRRGFRWLDSLFQDTRFALRMLRKNPGFTTVAVLTLALGIGANTAIFSVVNGVLVRPLPYPQPSQIVAMRLRMQSGSTNDGLSIPQFQFFRDRSGAFQAMAGVRPGADAPLKNGNAVEWVSTLQVTDGFFRVVSVTPSIGREFTAADTLPNGPAVVILTDKIWRNAFGADREIIGRQIEMNDRSYTVVGVMPPDFQYAEGPADAITPLQPGTASLTDRGMNTEVLARMKDGESLAQAEANMAVTYEQFRKQRTDDNGDAGVQLVRYQDFLADEIAPSLLMLFGAVGLLLLVACANVASLLLARANARETEISIRLALGASRGRLFQQLLTESLLLAASGAILGLLAAKSSLKAITASIPFALPTNVSFGLDGNVLAFTGAAAVVASLVFGLASFRQARKLDINSSLKRAMRNAGLGRHRAGSALVAGEIALATALLIGAALLIQSLYYLRAQTLGFDPQNVMTMATPFRASKGTPRPALWASQRQMLERIQAIPEVASVAAVTVPPLMGGGNMPAQRDGHPEDSIGGMEIRAISDNYFGTLGIPVLKGRSFGPLDNGTSTRVVMIDETVARRWWNGANPIGDRVVIGMMGGKAITKAPQSYEIAGIVGDVKGKLLAAQAPPMIYVPLSQEMADGGNPPQSWVIRTQGDVNISAALRAAVADVNPEQRVLLLMPLKHTIDIQTAGQNFDAKLLGLFAALALVLTSIGIYGVVSFHVGQRTHEIGVRVALGASRSDVMRVVLGQAMLLAWTGIAIGVIAALGLSRFLTSLLFHVRAADPATYAAAGIALTGVAFAACYIPARRAARVDPVRALRQE